MIHNEDLYGEKLSSCVELKRNLDENLWKQMIDLGKQFNKLTGLSCREFQLVKNMIYFQGGWPTHNTKPRLDTIVSNFSTICRVLSFLGRTKELERYCNQYGIRITITKPIVNSSDLSSMSREANHLLDKALNLQKEICKVSEVIKLKYAKKVENACGILIPHFLRDVRLTAKYQRKRTVDDDLQNFNLEISSARQVAESISRLSK